MFENFDKTGSRKVNLYIPTGEDWHSFGLRVSAWCKEKEMSHVWSNTADVPFVSFWFDPNDKAALLFVLTWVR